MNIRGHVWIPGGPGGFSEYRCANCGMERKLHDLRSQCSLVSPSPNPDTPTLAEIAASLRRIEAMITELAAAMLSK